MDLLQMETFVRLVRRGNFSRVARDLGVSQPSVTMRIKALEDVLGVTLVVRVGNTISLTPAGRAFYEASERALRLLRDGLDVAASGLQGHPRLVLAGTPTWSSYCLPPVLRQFRQIQSQCEISLYTGSSREVAAMVLDGLVDVGFVRNDHLDDRLVRIPAQTDRFCLVAPAAHPLARRDEVTIDDIRDEPVIGYHPGSDYRYLIEAMYRLRGAEPKIAMELSHVTSIRRMVAEGLGLGFLPWIAVRDDVATGRLAELRLRGQEPFHQFHSLVMLPEQASRGIVRTFVDVYTRHGEPVETRSADPGLRARRASATP